MLQKILIVFFLLGYSFQGYGQGIIDSSVVDVRNFKDKNLEKLRSNPDFNYEEEDIKEYNGDDNDWEWKKWRYEQEQKKKSQRKNNNEIEFQKVREEESPNLSIRLGESAIYIASAIAIIFLVLFILGVNPMSLFRRNAKITSQEIQEEDVDKLDKNNLDEKISQAIKKGDYTQAVRFLYLKTLFLLSQKQYIQLQREKTNLEYQQELRQNKNTLYDEFRYQSKIFAYIKYGGFEISQSQFDTLYPQFKNLHSKI
ncbi:MAG: hypothetical protein MUC49_03675 [Raineya sp.]|jgi:hypothetical protein|nr:hypothetical protein [Raineya sp.]